MHWFSNLTIGSRLSLSTAALSAALVTVVVGLGAASFPGDARLDSGGRIIASQLADSATQYILDKDSLALQALLNDLSRQALIGFAAVEDATHSVLAESHSAETSRPESREFSSPIQIHETIVGYARIGLAGTSSPMLPSTVILLLGVVVFAAVYGLMQLLLKRFHSTLHQLSEQLGKEGSGHRPGFFGELDALSEALEQAAHTMPKSSAAQRAVLALRIPKLEQEAVEPHRVASTIQALHQLARRQQGELHLRADGCLLLFTTGDAPCSRALGCARTLQSLLASGPEYAMAIAREDKANVPDQPVEYIARWHQICEKTYKLANREHSLMLCRSALSDPDVCDKVNVSQDDTGHYRVTAFVDEDQNAGLPGDSAYRPGLAKAAAIAAEGSAPATT